MFKIINRKWNRRDTILLLENIELYISSGLPIDRTLMIVGQSISTQHKLSIEKVRNDVISGYLLSRSLANRIGLSKTLTGLIEHGESSGELVRSLSTAKKLLEKEDELIKKCISALAYPVVIGVFASLLTIGLVRGVMPQIIPMLKSLHVQLPLLTRIVMFISENIVLYGLYMLFGIIVATSLFVISYKKLRFFRNTCQNILIRIPIIGSLVYSYSLSLFLQSCGVLIESGLQLSQSYSNTVTTVTLIPLSKLLQTESVHIRKGIPLGQILANKSKRIPTYVSPLILAGEASGTLGTSLVRAASIIDRDIEHSLKRLTSLIEPVVMAGMGVVVGGIALSIMMPIYDISKVLQQ